MIFIIGLVLSLIVILVMMDTHICVYYNYYSGKYDLKQEYDYILRVWHILLILFLGLIPVFNIIIFSVWLTYYAVHASWSPGQMCDTSHIPYLRGENILTRFLLLIKRILIKKI